MAVERGPDETGDAEAGDEADLERRRLQLEETLARKLPGKGQNKSDASTGGAAGYGQAMKLSSEFIAGILVGAGLGWVIDQFAGTSPWGLIVFLLLGFGAGVLNVLRAAGAVAEAGLRTSDKGASKPDTK